MYQFLYYFVKRHNITFKPYNRCVKTVKYNDFILTKHNKLHKRDIQKKKSFRDSSN